MTLATLERLSFFIGIFSYVLLTAFLVINWLRSITGKAILAASLLTLAFTLSSWRLGFAPATITFEFLASLAWIVFLSRIIGYQPGGSGALRFVGNLLIAAGLLTLVGILYAWVLPASAYAYANRGIAFLFIFQLLVDVIGLVMLEQVIRNTKDVFRWRQRYLSIALGTLFGFSLVVHATALLFYEVVSSLAVLQPLVFGMATPFLGIASLRNRTNALRVNLSHDFVFRSSVLVIAGSFLLALGVAGYYARLFGGDWGMALAGLIATAGILCTTVVLGSKKIRSHLRVVLTKTLFEYKYDYREEWLRVTRLLSGQSPDYSLGQQCLRAMMEVLGASGGGLWRLNESQVFIPEAHILEKWDRPLSPALSRSLIQFYQERNWVVDLENRQAQLESFLASTDIHTEVEGARYLIPLFSGNNLFGLAILDRPVIPIELNWEDYDILKLIGNQAANVLALQQADTVLGEARQLRAFQQLSAFLVHDIKTISAQLSLLVENAARHRNNPEFFDDMIETVNNAVMRMQKLLSGLREEQRKPLDLHDARNLAQACLDRYAHAQPRPVLTALTGQPCWVQVDEEQYHSALGHLVQNAVDATDPDGKVELQVSAEGDWVQTTIQDSGQGMEEDFVHNHLFTPFSSTKGLAGMGIGAYQARETIRRMGGDITVTSTPGEGTCFVVRVPGAHHD